MAPAAGLDVSAALQKFSEKYKSTEVARAGEIEVDAGNLMAVDGAPLEFERNEAKLDAQLLEASRDVSIGLGFVDEETFDRVVRPETMIGPK